MCSKKSNAQSSRIGLTAITMIYRFTAARKLITPFGTARNNLGGKSPRHHKLDGDPGGYAPTTLRPAAAGEPRRRVKSSWAGFLNNGLPKIPDCPLTA